MRERKEQEEKYIAENPDGCTKCFGRGYIGVASQEHIDDDFVTTTYNYCSCENGKRFKSEDAERVAIQEKERRKRMFLWRVSKMQSELDIISRAFSNAFDQKFYKNGAPMEFSVMELPNDSHESKRSKHIFRVALERLEKDLTKFLTNGGLNMYIYGDSGVGKSTSATSMFHKIRSERKDITSAYILFDEYYRALLSSFKDSHTKNPVQHKPVLESSLASRFEQLVFDCDILFVDEIFSQTGDIKPYYLQRLKELLDNRISKGRITVFISNKSMGEARTSVGSTLGVNDAEETRIFNRMRENNHLCDPELKGNSDAYGIRVIGKAMNAPMGIDNDFLAEIEAFQASKPLTTPTQAGGHIRPSERLLRNKPNEDRK